MKRNIVIFSIVIGIVLLFLVGCKKSTSDTIAFVGDEKDMMSCYDIYPKDYFPYNDCNYDTLLFPPDVVGEYEMNGTFVDGTYEYYNQMTHQYVPLPPQAYTPKSMYIIIEEQVNGMAKIRFSYKRNNAYKEWYSAQAYIYGDVYSDNPNDFMICYENTQGTETCRYFRGNIIKGTIGENGIINISTWSIIKDREYASLIQGIYNVYGYENYSATIAERKK